MTHYRPAPESAHVHHDAPPQTLIALIAAHLGRTRLIDNLPLGDA